MAGWDPLYSHAGSTEGLVHAPMMFAFGQTALFETPQVLTIGNFDGVHRGHQAVIAQARAAADARGMPLTALLFEPQPREVFARLRGDPPPVRLMTLRDKVEALADLHVDCVWCLRFDRIRQMTAEHFVASLIAGQRVSHLVVGDDFRFGADRRGDFTYLTEVGARFGFTLEQSATHCDGPARISSSRIRDALTAHDFDLAAQLLGRPFALSGRVIYGRQLGRTLGFPTANIRLPKNTPLAGVFGCEIRLPDGAMARGIANIGTRPTVSGGGSWLEVHLHHQNLELYGQRLTVIPRFFIRPEQKFESVELLSAQIAKDNRIALDQLTALLGPELHDRL